MFYLLSPKQKKKIQTEYWIKVSNLFSISLIVVYIIVIGLATPTVLKLYAELSTLNSQIEPLEHEISSTKVEVAKEGVTKILADVEILNKPNKEDISKIYKKFIEVVESVPGAKIQTVQVDLLSKSIQTTLFVRDKAVAQALVERIESEKYIGANLPYSVLSQKGSFVFAQKLSYENI